LVLGFHHEQQHQELLVTDIKHVFAQNPLYPVFREPKTGGRNSATPGSQSSPLQFVDFDEATVEIGHGGRGFAYDNEEPLHRALVLEFSLAARPVTKRRVPGIHRRQWLHAPGILAVTRMDDSKRIRFRRMAGAALLDETRRRLVELYFVRVSPDR